MSARRSIVQSATDAGEGLADLLAAHVKLAHLELSVDLRRVFQRVARRSLAVPMLVGGYAFAMAAAASVLAIYCGRLVALGSIAALQVVAGVVGLRYTLAALRRRTFLRRTAADLTSDVRRTSAALSDGTRSPDARLA